MWPIKQKENRQLLIYWPKRYGSLTNIKPSRPATIERKNRGKMND